MVQTRNLILQDAGRLSVRSRGTGDAGNLEVVADSIRLDNQGSIAAATTAAGEGGNIKLKTQSLQLRRNSIINAEADGSGNGGNISIDTGTLVALEYSNITANAFQGTGGSIKINTQGLFVDPTSKISASSTLGINGVVDINTTVNYVQTFLPTLEENFVSPDRVVAVSCLAQRNFKRGSFTVIGNGGLPSTPYGAFTALYGLTDVERLSGNSTAGERDDRLNESSTAKLGHSVSTGAMPSELATIAQRTRSSSTPPLQEAQGMFVTADGVVMLVTAPQLEALAKADDLICNSESSVSQSTE
jgi:large exoprotein involved in heme utilization and adhesion